MADASKQVTQAHNGDRKGDMANAPPKPVLESRSQSVREGRGSWTNFMGSYLLKGKEYHISSVNWHIHRFSPVGNEDDEDEGKRILGAVRQAEFETKMKEYREQRQRDGKH